MLLGEEALEKLNKSTVLVFGLGGVGSHTALALARCGIGRMIIVDNDRVNLTNINRQAIAFHSTIGRLKTEVTKELLLDINPDIKVVTNESFVLPGNLDGLITDEVNYIVDAIDTVTAKLAIAELAAEKGIPVISCMGTGNKLNPQEFRIADISQTRMCPLCKVMRKELKNRGITRLKVLYSEEKPLTPRFEPDGEEKGARRSVPGSVAFVPPVAGLMIAAEVVRGLSGVQAAACLTEKDTQRRL